MTVESDLLARITTPVSPSGRFRLVKASEIMSPGKCVSCGVIPGGSQFAAVTSDNEEFKSVTVDAGVEHLLDGSLVFEFYGTAYWCETCTVEMASLFGALSPGQARQLLESTENLIAQRDLLQAEANRLEELNAALMADAVRNRNQQSGIYFAGPVDVGSAIEELAAETVSEQTEENNGAGLPEKPEPTTSPRNPEIDEPIIEQRSDELHSDSSEFNTDDFIRNVTGLDAGI